MGLDACTIGPFCFLYLDDLLAADLIYFLFFCCSPEGMHDAFVLYGKLKLSVEPCKVYARYM